MNIITMEYEELFSNNEPDIYSSDDEEEPYLVVNQRFENWQLFEIALEKYQKQQ